MAKELSEMTLEELWELFPIILKEYDTAYPTWYEIEEEKVYHLHVRYADNWNELYFRDYLIEHPEVAKEYVDLKRQLKEKYEHNRDAYTDAKGEFINKYSEIAKVQYGEQYMINTV